MAAQPAKMNTIEQGTIKIANFKTADLIAEQLLATPGMAAQITRIEFLDELDDETKEADSLIELSKAVLEAGNPMTEQPVTTQDMIAPTARVTEIETTNELDQKEENEGKELVIRNNKSYSRGEERNQMMDREANRLCQPLNTILQAIIDQGGSLTHFLWLTPYPGDWSQVHFTRPSSFWQALYAHSQTLETLHIGVAPRETNFIPVPDTTFPALRHLMLNTDSAHGDDGMVIDKLLAGSPALETLDFRWPCCDLYTCQIQNISWSYTFPRLRSFTAHGYAFAPEAYSAFISRHPSLENLDEKVDGPYEPSAFTSSIMTDTRNTAQELLAAVKPARPGDWLTELRLCGDSRFWRPGEEDRGDEKKDQGQEDKGLSGCPSALRSLLQEHRALEKLTITHQANLSDQTHGLPKAMDKMDLTTILTLLPETGPIKVLCLEDTRGKALPRDFLENFPPVPASLEYVEWETDSKVRYRIEKECAKIKAVVCDDETEDNIVF